MRILLVFVLFISYSAYSQEVVWDYEQIKSINSKINVNGLGISQTPFFKYNNSINKDFLKTGTCYRLKINQKNFRQSIRRIPCNIDFSFFIKIGNIKYHQVDSSFYHQDQNIKFEPTTYTKEFKATTTDFKSYNEGSTPDELNIINITINHKFSTYFQVKDGFVKLISGSETEISKLGFLPKTLRKKSYEVKFRKYYNDRIFSNAHEILLLKNYQPEPFRIMILSNSEDYLNYLEVVEQSFYHYNNKPICFRDNYYSPTAFDCHNLLFPQNNQYQWKNFNLLKINKDTNTLEAL